MARVKGSKEGKIVTASFDGKSKSNFPSFKATPTFRGTKDLVLLSIIGNEFCQGDYLGAIVDQAVATHEFSTFLIADEIYWHNLKRPETSSKEEEALKKQAIDLGSKYFENQLPCFLKPLGLDVASFNRQYPNKNTSEKMAIINELATKYHFEILRWSDWVNRASENFTTNKNELINLYTEGLLKKSVDEQAANFARRHTDTESYDLSYQRARGYLTEESLVIMCLAAQLDYSFIVYPGDMPKPFQATKDYFIRDSGTQSSDDGFRVSVEKPHLVANWLEVNFTRKDEPKNHLTAAVPTSLPDTTTTNTNEKNRPMRYEICFFEAPASDKKISIDSLAAATLIGITKTVLESSLTADSKEKFLENLIAQLTHNSHQHSGVSVDNILINYKSL